MDVRPTSVLVATNRAAAERASARTSKTTAPAGIAGRAWASEGRASVFWECLVIPFHVSALMLTAVGKRTITTFSRCLRAHYMFDLDHQISIIFNNKSAIYNMTCCDFKRQDCTLSSPLPFERKKVLL
jgi:hypothetical protein